jgi:hypothetical protein
MYYKNQIIYLITFKSSVMTPRHATVPEVQAVQSAESWLSRDNRAQVM